MCSLIIKRAVALFVMLAVSGTVLAASTLEGLDFQQGASGELEVDLDFSGLVPEVRGYRIDDPPRLTIDLMETDNHLDRRSYTLGIGGVQRVTTLEAGSRTRLVFELEGALPYNTRQQGSRLRLAIGGGATATSVSSDGETPASAKTASATDFASSEPAPRQLVSGGPSIEDIDFRRGSDGAGRLVVTFDRAGIDARVNESGRNRITAELVGVELPMALDQVYDVSDFGTPLQRVTPRVGRNGVTLDIQGSGDYAMVATQSGRQLTIEAQPVARQEQERRVREQFSYTGDRITLNFQDIEVRAVLAIIADFTGLNLVASDSVQGSVTLNLEDVPWDQALDLVLKSHGLASRQEGDVIVVAPAAELAQREQLELQARKQLETLAPLETEYIEVKYAKANDIATLLRGQDGFGLLTERGKVAVDTRTNTLLIQDTVEQISTIMDTLERLDVAVRQVQIEARIVVASESATRQLGVSWRASSPDARMGGRLDLGGASSGTSPSGGLSVDLGPSGSGETGFAFGFLSGDILLDLELRALESEDKSQIISQPRIVTANQKKAVITQGQERAYRVFESDSGEDGVNNTRVIEFKKAELALEVTPQITPDNRVILDIALDNDSFGEPRVVGGEPPVDTNSLEAQVLVDNGETVVLGGILRIESGSNIDKTPFLGDLPVLGKLFRYTEQRNEKVELLVFITPRILDDDVALR